MLMYRKCGEV
jgi:hypothetical protein